jgi:glucokinase
MQSPRFMAAATDKGRMRGVVERMPIFLITCNRLGVQGAIANAMAQSHYALPHHLNSNTVAIRSGT